MKEYIGIIGGSGLYSIDEFEHLEDLNIKTPYGEPSSPLKVGRLAGVDVIFIARHGEGHVYNPSEINYRANIWAMKKSGVKAIFSVSAVGSLKDEIGPGQMLILDQYIDRTRTRPSTFFENGIVIHVSLAHPVSNYLREILINSCKKVDVTCHEKGTYICMEGPQFSTVAESNFYRQLNAEVIGMTSLQEAKLAREAEIDYATLALITDYDCWHPDHDNVTTDQVIAVVKKNSENAKKILIEAVTEFDFSKKLEAENAIEGALMTNRDLIKPEVLERLQPIIGKYF